MSTAGATCWIAASQVGNKEQPLGSNNAPPYTTEYGMRGAWCAMFVSWCLRHAGVPVGPHAKGFAWVSDGIRWWEQQGRLAPVGSIRPGDVVPFEWGTTPGGFDHVGFAISAPDAGGNFQTVEGNVGDAVRVLTRNINTSGIPYVARPAYSVVAPPPPPPPSADPPPPGLPVVRQGSRGPAVVKVQELIKAINPQASIAIDGVFGPRTRKAVEDFQRFFKLRVDGIVGPQTWRMLYYIAWISVASRG